MVLVQWSIYILLAVFAILVWALVAQKKKTSNYNYRKIKKQMILEKAIIGSFLYCLKIKLVPQPTAS